MSSGSTTSLQGAEGALSPPRKGGTLGVLWLMSAWGPSVPCGGAWTEPEDRARPQVPAAEFVYFTASTANNNHRLTAGPPFSGAGAVVLWDPTALQEGSCPQGPSLWPWEAGSRGGWCSVPPEQGLVRDGPPTPSASGRSPGHPCPCLLSVHHVSGDTVPGSRPLSAGLREERSDGPEVQSARERGKPRRGCGGGGGRSGGCPDSCGYWLASPSSFVLTQQILLLVASVHARFCHNHENAVGGSPSLSVLMRDQGPGEQSPRPHHTHRGPQGATSRPRPVPSPQSPVPVSLLNGAPGTPVAATHWTEGKVFPIFLVKPRLAKAHAVRLHKLSCVIRKRESTRVP